jgi:hypothetical protein
MKHLKTFNETITWNPAEFKQELQEFCENNLAYLLDDTADLYVTNVNDWDEYSSWQEDLHKIQLNITLPFGTLFGTIPRRSPKKWNEIKDHMIPFLIRLNKEYEVIKFVHLDTSLAHDSKNKVEDLINDKPSFDSTTDIYSICLYVKDYKEEKPKGFISKIKSFFK